MSSALLPANTAAPLDRQTPEGERVLHEALGYIARGDAAYTRRAYAGDRQPPSVREVVRRLDMISHFQRGGTEG